MNWHLLLISQLLMSNCPCTYIDDPSSALHCQPRRSEFCLSSKTSFLPCHSSLFTVIQVPGKALHYTTLQCLTALQWSDCSTLNCTELNCTELHFTTQHRSALQFSVLFECNELNYNALNLTATTCNAMRFTPLNWTALDCSVLGCTALHWNAGDPSSWIEASAFLNATL